MHLVFLLTIFLPLASCMMAPVTRVDRRPPSRESFHYTQQRVSAIVVTRQTDISEWVRRGFPQSQTPPDTDGGSVP